MKRKGMRGMIFYVVVLYALSDFLITVFCHD